MEQPVGQRERRVKPNIYERHQRNCRWVQNPKRRCDCTPSYFVAKSITIDGVTKQRRQTFPRVQDAEAWLAEFDARKKRGLVSSLDTSLRSHLEDLDDRLRRGVARQKNGKPYKPRSIILYRHGLRTLLALEAPELDKPVDAISVRDMQRLTDLLSEYLEYASVKAIQQPLRVVWGELARQGDLRNPMLGVVTPRPLSRPEEIIDPHVAVEIIERLPIKDRIIFGLALHTGARSGEIRALRWCDIDLDKRQVNIHRNYSGRELTTPKSEAGTRIVGFGQILAQQLGDYRNWVKGNRRAEFLEPHALVVPKQGDPFSPFEVTSLYRRVKKIVGVDDADKVKLHGLRKAYTSILVNRGVDLKTIQRTTGHASASLTLGTYTRLLTTDSRVTADVMDEFLSPFSGWVTDPRVAEVEAWRDYEVQLDQENWYLEQAAEAQGGGFRPRQAPLFDM
jgi:integrase